MMFLRGALILCYFIVPAVGQFFMRFVGDFRGFVLVFSAVLIFLAFLEVSFPILA